MENKDGPQTSSGSPRTNILPVLYFGKGIGGDLLLPVKGSFYMVWDMSIKIYVGLLLM